MRKTRSDLIIEHLCKPMYINERKRINAIVFNSYLYACKPTFKHTFFFPLAVVIFGVDDPETCVTSHHCLSITKCSRR